MAGTICAGRADAFGIDEATLYAWLKKHPELDKAIRESKENMDSLVERSLFERATGIKIEGKDGVYSVPPDVTAQKFWLITRRREQWRDVQRIEHTGKDGESLFPSLADLKAELLKRGAVDASGRLKLENPGDEKIVDVSEVGE